MNIKIKPIKNCSTAKLRRKGFCPKCDEPYHDFYQNGSFHVKKCDKCGRTEIQTANKKKPDRYIIFPGYDARRS